MMPLPLSTALEFVPRISTCSNCCFIALHCFGNVVFYYFLVDCSLTSSIVVSLPFVPLHCFSDFFRSPHKTSRACSYG